MIVKFHASIGLSNCYHEEDIEIDDDDIKDMSESQLNEFLDEELEGWVQNFMDMSWSIEE